MLVPIDTEKLVSNQPQNAMNLGNSQGAASGNPGYSRPRTTQHDIVLSVEEVRCNSVSFSQSHFPGRGEGCLQLYPGYISIAWKPSCGINAVLVHSQTPPSSPCPAR